MERLAAIDTVAYVRFASVYKNFQATDDFEDFLAELRPDPPGDLSHERPTPTGASCAAGAGAGSARAGACLAEPGGGLRHREGRPRVGRGWTQDGGRPHAERVALDQAGRGARARRFT
jgi:hypothetical protein